MNDDIYTGKDLIDYIKDNHLEDIEVQTMWVEGLVFSVYLDEEHNKEIEYTWAFNGDDEVLLFEWFNENGGVKRKDTILTPEEALKMRGLA